MAQSAALISTEELARRMGAPALRIFDCTTYLRPRPEGGYNAESGRANYDKGHIPGAAFLDLGGELSDPQSKLRFTLPPLDRAHQGVRRQGHRPRHLRRALQPRHADLGDAHLVDAARGRLRRCGDPRRRARQVEGGEPPALDRGHDLSAGHALPARTARDLRRQERHQGGDRQDRHADLECAQPRPAQGHGRRGLRPAGRIAGSSCVPAASLFGPDKTLKPIAELRAGIRGRRCGTGQARAGLLRRRHRRHARCVCADRASRPQERLGVRQLHAGMVERPQPADGNRLREETTWPPT